MADNESRPTFGFPHQVPGFIESLLLFLGSFSDYFSARLQLFGLESKEVFKKLLWTVVLLVVTLVLLLFAYIFFIVALVFLIEWLTKWNWMYITFGAAALHFLGAIICLLMTKSCFKGGAFSATIAEFKKDKEWLTSKHHTA